jgi:hypothetical protein
MQSGVLGESGGGGRYARFRIQVLQCKNLEIALSL